MNEARIGNNLEKQELEQKIRLLAESSQNNLGQLKENIKMSHNVRDFLMNQLKLSSNKENNSKYGNFSLGLIDGLLEFPAIVELFINNSEFREQLWITIKKITIKDFVNSIIEMGDDFVNGDAYKRGKSSLRILLFATGLGGLLRGFGVLIAKNGTKISAMKVSTSIALTGFHSVGYASENVIKNGKQ